MFARYRRLSHPDDPELLLLRPPAGFGDHLMLSAVIEGIKAEQPRKRIVVAARFPEVFDRNPHVERAFAINLLRKQDPCFLAQFRQMLFREPVDRYLQVSGHLIEDMYARLDDPPRERPRQPRIYLTETELSYRAAEIERLPHPRIAIVPFGKPDVRLPNKVYPHDQWEALCRLLVGLGGTVLHLGTEKDGPLVEGARDYRDIGFRNTGGVLRRCDLLVTHVGGIMHLAAALHTPTVVLYGAAEHPAISGYPWNRNLYVPIECGPCWMEGPCSHHSCMRQLTPGRVLEEVREALRALERGHTAAGTPRPDPIPAAAAAGR